MFHVIEKSMVLVLVLATGVVACVDDPQSTQPASEGEIESLASNVATVAVAIPDEAGALHNAVIMVSPDIAPRARDLLDGVQAIVRSGKTAGVAAADGRLAFQQRTAQASAAISAAVSADQKAVVAIVFEDSSVLGWRGPMRPASGPGGPAQTNGGTWFNEGLQTSDPAILVATQSHLCPAGAGAQVTMQSGTTSTNVALFMGGAFPGGAATTSPVTLASVGASFRWPPNFFVGNNTFYHVRSRQTGPVGLTTAVNTAIDCYWFGF